MITLNRVGGVRLCFPLQVGQWAVQLCSFSHCLQHKTIYTHTSSAWVFCRYPNCRGWITLIRLSRWVNGRSWWFSHTLFTSISFKLQSFFLFMRYNTCISDKIRNWKWSTETISHPARLYYPHVQTQCPCPQVLRHKTSTISMSTSQSTEAKNKSTASTKKNKYLKKDCKH